MSGSGPGSGPGPGSGSAGGAGRAREAAGEDGGRAARLLDEARWKRRAAGLQLTASDEDGPCRAELGEVAGRVRVRVRLRVRLRGRGRVRGRVRVRVGVRVKVRPSRAEFGEVATAA